MDGVVKWRKRPIVVEVMQWTGDNLAALVEWTGGLFRATDEVHQATAPGVTGEVFDRLHGTWVGVKTGDSVVRGVQGEHYPIDAAVLAETYELADITADPSEMPVGVLLDELIGDGSSDYNDGDNAGYYRHVYDPETGLLHVHYEHAEEDDEDGIHGGEGDAPPYGPVTYRFQFIGPVDRAASAEAAQREYSNAVDDGDDHDEAIVYALRQLADDKTVSLTAAVRALLAIEDET